jgi:very-short-patch-repair endonuclease/predicted transcriptional regulator of viral defense system
MRHIDAQGRSRENGSTSETGSRIAIDRAIGDLARSQYGIVSLDQLADLGISRDRVRGRVRRGILHRVHRGVYAVGHCHLSREGRWLAATLATGAALSHVSAAEAWGLIPPRRGRIEVTRQRGWRSPAGVIVHVSALPEDERAVLDGIPVTSVSRTLLDLGGLLDRTGLERAINEAEVRELRSPTSIPELLSRYPRRRGTAVLRRILGDLVAGRGVAANDFEAAFTELVASHGLPKPRFNADLAVRGRFVKPDAMWEREKLIVELDGRAAHGTPRAFERDRERDRRLLLDGWRTVRVTWLQLRDAPESVAADIRELLADAATSTLRA